MLQQTLANGGICEGTSLFSSAGPSRVHRPASPVQSPPTPFPHLGRPGVQWAAQEGALCRALLLMNSPAQPPASKSGTTRSVVSAMSFAILVHF